MVTYLSPSGDVIDELVQMEEDQVDLEEIEEGEELEVEPSSDQVGEQTGPDRLGETVQEGIPQEGVPQEGVPQEGVPQEGVVQEGVVEEGTRDPSVVELSSDEEEEGYYVCCCCCCCCCCCLK